MKATFANLLYVDGQPYNYTIKITVTDIAGKTTDFTMNLAEIEILEETRISFVLCLLVIFTLGILIPKKKRR
jgi:hypothetical protein